MVLLETHMHWQQGRWWFIDMYGMSFNVLWGTWGHKQSITMCGVVGHAYAPMAEQRMDQWHGSDVHQWRNKWWLINMHGMSFNCMWVTMESQTIYDNVWCCGKRICTDGGTKDDKVTWIRCAPMTEQRVVQRRISNQLQLYVGNAGSLVLVDSASISIESLLLLTFPLTHMSTS